MLANTQKQITSPSHNPHRIKKKLTTFQGHDTFIYTNARSS